MIISFSLFLISCSEKTIEIPFQYRNDRLFVKAEINGISGNYFFDTGGIFSMVTDNTVIENMTFLENWRYRLFNGEFNSPLYSLENISFSGKKIKTRAKIAFASDEEIKRDFGYGGVDGILALDIFQGYWFEISFSKNKFILHKNKPDYFVNFIPAMLEQDKFTIPIEINGKNFYSVIDTGDWRGITFYDGTRTAVKKENCYKVLSNTGNYYLLKTETVKLFDDTIKNGSFLTDAMPAMRAMAGIAGGWVNIGAPYLKNYDLLFDLTRYPNSTSGIYYSALPERSKNNFFINTATGIIDYQIYSYGLYINSIIENSMAHTAGIECGTLITKINGKRTASMTRDELENMKPPEIKTVTFVKNGIVKKVEIMK